MTGNAQTWLVVNTASGSNEADCVASLQAQLVAAGFAPDRTIDAQAEDVPDRDAVTGARVDLLVVFTGDGTLNCVLNGVAGWDGKVLVLPGGTANLLAKALHGDRGTAEIVARLSQLATVRRTAVRSAHGTALIELLAGPGAAWSDVREAMRDGDIGDVVSGGIEAAQKSVASQGVRISDPPIGREEGYTGVRLTPDAGGIAVAGYGAQGFGDIIRQGLALLRRDYREGPHDELGLLAEIECTALDGEPIALMIDGERRTGCATERFSLVELPLDLLAAEA